MPRLRGFSVATPSGVPLGGAEQGELAEHLGYEHGEEAPPVQTNRRNGVSRKWVKDEAGAFGIEVPRDREGSFEPRLISKGQTRIDGSNDKIIAIAVIPAFSSI